MTIRETMLHISAFVFNEQLCVDQIMCSYSWSAGAISHSVDLAARDKCFLVDNQDSGLLFIGLLSLT